MRAVSKIIKVHFSFWLAAGVFWAMGLGWDFIMVAAALTFHELAHVLVAKAFGCKIRQLKISALGEMALVHHMEHLSPLKRIGIIVAGPACNLFLWLVTQNMNLGLFGFYNLVLSGFNLLPIFPLDGARLIQLWAGNLIGIMKVNRLILHIGLVCCAILMMLGIVQAVLYAPNFTMLFAGFALWRKNRNLKLELTGEFYMAILSKPSRLAKSPMPIRYLCACSHQPLPYLIDLLSWDHILMISVTDKDNAIVTELELINYVIQHGLSNTLADIAI